MNPLIIDTQGVRFHLTCSVRLRLKAVDDRMGLTMLMNVVYSDLQPLCMSQTCSAAIMVR